MLDGALEENQQCLVYEKFHDLEDYFIYLGIRFLYTKKLCYGCPQSISRNHDAKNCSKRRTYKICKEEHLTTLHGLNLEKGSKDGSGKNKISIDPLLKDTKDQTNASGKVILCNFTYARVDIVSACVMQVKVITSSTGL